MGNEKEITPIVIAAMVAVAVVMVTLAAFIIPASASGNPGAGCPSDTRFYDTIHGGVYFEQEGWALYKEMTQTFEVPYEDIKIARIYTGVWQGSPGKGGFFNITIVNATGGTYITSTYKACDPCPEEPCAGYQNERCDALNASINWDCNQNLDRANMHDCIVGCGVHFVSFNATPYITPGTNTITVKTAPCSACTAGGWDGRIYLIALLVVYENSSMPEITYWINEGALYLEKGSACDGPDDHLYASKYFNGTHVSDPTRVKLWSLGWPHVINATESPAYTKLNGNNIGYPDITEIYGSDNEVLLRWNNIPTDYLDTSNLLEYYDPDPYYERAFVEVLIVHGPSNLPDLTVKGMEFPAVMRPNKDYTITATIENHGNVSAGAFNVSLEVERGGVTYYSDKKTLSGLDAGASTPVIFTNVNLPEGCYNFTVTADCDGDVAEESDKNNKKTEKYQVGYVIIVRKNSDFDDLVSDGLATKVGDTYYIENLAITNCVGDGIVIENTDVPFVIRNCTVHHCEYNGIRLFRVKNGKINDGEVYNCKMKGIRIRNCSHIFVENNYVHDNLKYGIDIYPEKMPHPDCECITVSNNTIERNLYGIELLGFNCTIRDNIILNTTSWGGGEEGWGIYIAGNYSKIYNNTVAYSDSYGIYADNDMPSLPTFWNCIFGNTFIDNNKLIPHPSQAYDSGINYWNSTVKLGYYNNTCGAACAHDNYIGNYWSDLACTDANNDGICDSSYNICGGTMKDYAPLVQPWANYERIMCGDVNCDGAVNVGDVYPVFKRTVCSDWTADVNCDCAINVGDVYPVFKRILECCTGCKICT